MSEGNVEDTQTPEYANYLHSRSAGWKRLAPTQLPYRMFLRRQSLGLTLDVGCGHGRNLANLGSQAIGVDHNPLLITAARSAGHTAYTVEEFAASEWARPARFDALLCSHVLEHLDAKSGHELLETYLPYVRPGGKVLLLTPQERGYRLDSTHIRYLNTDDLTTICGHLDLRVARRWSYPFPRAAGKYFPYNENIVLAYKE